MNRGLLCLLLPTLMLLLPPPPRLPLVLADTHLKNPVELVGWSVELSTARVLTYCPYCQRGERGTANVASTSQMQINDASKPFLQKKAGVQTAVCSAKIKRLHNKATFVPCKHHPASWKQ